MIDTRASTVSCFQVVLADDDAMVIEALTGVLGDHPALQVVGACSTGFDAADLCSKLGPHLALIDVVMPGGGLGGLAAIKLASPETVVAFYTAQADRRTCSRLLGAGAAAVFAKGAPIDLATSVHDLALSAFSARS